MPRQYHTKNKKQIHLFVSEKAIDRLDNWIEREQPKHLGCLSRGSVVTRLLENFLASSHPEYGDLMPLDSKDGSGSGEKING
jgi:hypothetical protein